MRRIFETFIGASLAMVLWGFLEGPIRKAGA